MKVRGKVYLVGAGPGDPDLLTVKAARTLRAADVVLHDALISPEVLALASDRAEILDVGKRCGNKCIAQEEINALMVSFAEAGNQVVRLKSGDPLVFGRAAEELDVLRRAGVEVEIVPGITCALAAAAATGIALTDRRRSGQIVLVSAHRAEGREGPDWNELIPSCSTLVIYMPGQQKCLAERLMRAGWSGQTACIVVSRISRPEQRCCRTTLEMLADAPALPAPSLLIVGDVAANSPITKLRTVCTASLNS